MAAPKVFTGIFNVNVSVPLQFLGFSYGFSFPLFHFCFVLDSLERVWLSRGFYMSSGNVAHMSGPVREKRPSAVLLEVVKCQNSPVFANVDCIIASRRGSMVAVSHEGTAEFRPTSRGRTPGKPRTFEDPASQFWSWTGNPKSSRIDYLIYFIRSPKADRTSI